MHSPFRH
jgi:hypothetical protein